MKETDLRVGLDMILKSDDDLDVEVRRALVQEFVDRFFDVVRDLRLPPGMSWEGFKIDGDASPASDRKVVKRQWNDMAMISRSLGDAPDFRRR